MPVFLSDDRVLEACEGKLLFYLGIAGKKDERGGLTSLVKVVGVSRSQICANRLILANQFRVPELNPFLRIALRGAKKFKSQVITVIDL